MLVLKISRKEGSGGSNCYIAKLLIFLLLTNWIIVLELKIIDQISSNFNAEFPHAETMDDYLDLIIPNVRSWGEDLREEQFYLNKPWMELRDDVNFHTAVLHFFNDGGEYLKSTDGDVSGGSWRYLDSANKLMLNDELYDLAFMDNQFFILRKHGNQKRLGQRKYFVMMYEPIAARLEWREAMEYLFNQYRNNNSFYTTLAVIILLIIAIVLILS